MWIRLKIMCKKDSDKSDPKNWLVTVKEIMEDGTVKKHPDASVLKGGNMRIQPGIELSSMMQSAKEGMSCDYQIRDLLIVERLAGTNTNSEDLAEADPGIAARIASLKRAAAEKASAEAGPSEEPAAKAKKEAPVVSDDEQ